MSNPKMKQKLPDNEFFQLFERQMDEYAKTHPHKKNSIWFYYSAAAIVILAMGISILFYQKKETGKNQLAHAEIDTSYTPKLVSPSGNFENETIKLTPISSKTTEILAEPETVIQIEETINISEPETTEADIIDNVTLDELEQLAKELKI